MSVFEGSSKKMLGYKEVHPQHLKFYPTFYTNTSITRPYKVNSPG
jgi:hypothetical protein